MNQQQREIFRETVLRAFKAGVGCGLSLETLAVALGVCGFRNFTVEEMEREIQYFTDKGFLAEVTKSHSVGNRIWRLTAAGVDDLERRGL